ncbi:hypothetical protein [Ectobacillus sp. sgz5001026]|uniref:hypothetical protein n=1 Tax=Ectobacillus sp. sgz5001026 TaxID=3242473 RepID=UPI0036D24D45
MKYKREDIYCLSPGQVGSDRISMVLDHIRGDSDHKVWELDRISWGTACLSYGQVGSDRIGMILDHIRGDSDHISYGTA